MSKRFDEVLNDIQVEQQRKIDRYDEAVSLLLDSRHLEGNAFPAIWRAARDAFLAAEPKTEERNG